MAGPGRNAPCPCGSGRKVKYCCGERSGPRDADLAVAALHREARKAAAHVRRHSGIDNCVADVAAVESMLVEASLIEAVADLARRAGMFFRGGVAVGVFLS